MDPLIGSAVIGAGASLAGSLLSGKSTKRQVNAAILANRENIDSQERINNQNVALQDYINQQNIDAAEHINSLMRYDSKHAISDKKSDLIRAGYSAADPSLQGFSAANLSQPQLEAATMQAPRVEPTYTAATAQTELNSINSIISAAKLSSEVSLMQAQAKSQNANATGQEIDNAWKDVQNQAKLQESYARIRDLVTHGDVNENTAKQILISTDKLQSEVDIFKETFKQEKFKTEHQQEEFTNRMNQLKASVVDLNASAGLKDSQKALTRVEKELMSIKKMYADVGINFDDNSIIGSLAKLVHAGKSAEVTHEIVQMCKDILSQLWTETKSIGSPIVEGAKKAGKKVVETLGGSIANGSFKPWL